MRTNYASRLRIPIDGSLGMCLFTAGGAPFSIGYVRVVIGGRGPYVELRREQVVCPLHDVDAPHYYYVERRTADGVKIYDQLRRVSYADYVPGFLYVSPFDLRSLDGSEIIAPIDAAQGKLFG